MKRVLLLTLACCLACKVNGSGREAARDGGDGSTPSSAVSVSGSAVPSGASPVAVALCGYLERCVPAALNAFSHGRIEHCIEYFSCGATGLAALTVAPLLDDAACVAEIEGSACGALPLGSDGPAPRLLPKSGSACSDPDVATRGTAGVGDRCFSGERKMCGGMLYCKLDQPLRSRGGSLCGVCTEPARRGAACTPGERCEDEAYCSDAHCVPRLGLDQPCSGSGDCRSGLFCQAGRCAHNQSFLLVADGANEGKACSFERPCGDITLRCSQGKCQRLGDQGDACVGVNACRAGLHCGEDERCSAPRSCTDRPGAVCGAETACTSPLLCVLSAERQGHCQAPVIGHAEGEACTVGCDGDSLICAAGVCTKPATASTLGRPCASSFDCTGSVCDRDIAPFCTLRGSSFLCNAPSCEGCGTCIERPTPAACDD